MTFRGTVAVLFTFAVGITVCSLAWFGLIGQQTASLRNVASTLASVSATLLGFMTAALTILVALLERRIVRRLRKLGKFETLINEMVWAATSFLLTTIFALAALFVPPEHLRCMVSISAFFAGMAVCWLVFSGRKFSNLIAVTSQGGSLR